LISAAFHLSGASPGNLVDDLVLLTLILVAAGLSQWDRLIGSLCFFCLLPLFLVFVAASPGSGHALSNFTAYSALLLLPAALAALYFGFGGVLVFSGYALVIGAVTFPLSLDAAWGVTWNMLAAFTVGAVLAGLLEAVDRTLAQLHRAAYQDPLTGLGNRRALEVTLDQRCRAGEAPVGLGLVDLDGLKDVNDQYGHHAGDLLLQHFAQGLRNSLLPGELLFRLGGDEYVMVAHQDQLPELRAQVHLAVAHVRAQGFEEFSASVGLAGSHEVGEGQALLRLADLRMYQEKQRQSRRTLPPGALGTGVGLASDA
jgi:diguanylate cyclase (GGDEF)-like protein